MQGCGTSKSTLTVLVLYAYGYKTTVQKSAQHKSADTDFEAFPVVGGGLTENPAPNPLSPFIDIAGPFADAATIQAAAPDAIVIIYIDGYQSPFDPTRWKYVPRIAYVENNSNDNIIPAYGYMGDVRFNMGGQIRPGDNASYSIPYQPTYIGSGGSTRVYVFLKADAAGGAPLAGGARSSAAMFYQDSQNYLFRVTFDPTGWIDVDN